MFAPIVIALKNWLGTKAFDRTRGKAIALHARVITAVCNRFGVDSSYRQNLIRLAKNHGKQLGLLA
ncbi:electron transporter [Altericista sp. CCNU0014]|uniref:cyclic electron transport protein PGR5 n=1 Tax=Altericista sp. CCNU0014 TaxID=3082949 RepID=UPI00384ACA61